MFYGCSSKKKQHEFGEILSSLQVEHLLLSNPQLSNMPVIPANDKLLWEPNPLSEYKKPKKIQDYHLSEYNHLMPKRVETDMWAKSDSPGTKYQDRRSNSAEPVATRPKSVKKQKYPKFSMTESFLSTKNVY